MEHESAIPMQMAKLINEYAKDGAKKPEQFKGETGLGERQRLEGLAGSIAVNYPTLASCPPYTEIYKANGLQYRALAAAERFLDSYVTWRLLEVLNNGVMEQLIKRDGHENAEYMADIFANDPDAFHDMIFENFLGQQVQVLFYAFTDQQVQYTKGGDFWHQDDSFGDSICRVVENMPVNLWDLYGRE